MDDESIWDLIGAIYEAPLEPQQWTRVVRRIKSETKSRSAHFWCGTIDDTVGDFTASPDQYLAFEHDRLSFSELNAYVRSIQASSLRDPHLERQHQAPKGRAFLWSELVPADEYRRSVFYNEFGLNVGVYHGLASVMIRERRFIDAIFFGRPEIGSPYSKRDIALLDLLTPHIARALHLHNRLQQSDTQSSLLRNSFDTLQSAIVLLKQNGHVIFLNRTAEELIGQCAELYLRRDRLCATNHADCLRLEQLIRTAIGGNGTQPSGGGMTMRRPKGRRLQILAAPVPLDSRATLMAGLGPVAMLVIYDPDHQAYVPHEIVATMFGLTPSETRLLLALNNGYTLKQYGNELHVTQNTARAHLKSVFAKTKMSKQSDLIRLMRALTQTLARPSR